jgi:hypothetical protein
MKPLIFSLIMILNIPLANSQEYSGYGNNTEGPEDKSEISYSGFQFGYLGAITKGNFSGFQYGGYFNIVTGNFSGFQMSMMFNYTKKNTKGVQLAYMNYTGKNFSGIQLGLIGSYTKGDMKGLQLSLVGNIAKGNSKGIQLAMGNYANKLSGVQLGMVNYAGSMSGLQLGMLNISGNSPDLYQFGYFNFAKSVSFQYGFLNVAQNAGWQMGYINISNKIKYTPFGLINICFSDGGIKLVTWNDSLTGMNTGIKFRAKHVYSMFSYGSNNIAGNIYIPRSFGFFYGLHFKLNKKLYIESDLGFTTFNNQQYYSVKQGDSALDHVFQWRIMAGLKITERFRLFGGISINSDDNDKSFIIGASLF